jgi:hypothetical protein
MSVTDEEFFETVVAACRRLPNAEAVNLGGSRARGDFRPFEWGHTMYGGAVFDLDGRHFDIHYRSLDVVEHWIREAIEGRFEVHILGFHLAGIPTYMLPGERPAAAPCGAICRDRAILMRFGGARLPFGWTGPTESSSTRPTGLLLRTPSVARGRWPRSFSRALTPGWPTAASGR